MSNKHISAFWVKEFKFSEKSKSEILHILNYNHNSNYFISIIENIISYELSYKEYILKSRYNKCYSSGRENKDYFEVRIGLLKKACEKALKNESWNNKVILRVNELTDLEQDLVKLGWHSMKYRMGLRWPKTEIPNDILKNPISYLVELVTCCDNALNGIKEKKQKGKTVKRLIQIANEISQQFNIIFPQEKFPELTRSANEGSCLVEILNITIESMGENASGRYLISQI